MKNDTRVTKWYITMRVYKKINKIILNTKMWLDFLCLKYLECRVTPIKYHRSILQILDKIRQTSLNRLHISSIIFRNHSLCSIIQPHTSECSSISLGPVSKAFAPIVWIRESWREVGGIRGVSWIHCDAFHVELFVLPGGVQFGEPGDTTVGNPDTSATVSATKTPSGLADANLGASIVSQH